MKKIFPLFLFIYCLTAVASDPRPQFQTQVLNQAGTSPVDPNARSWTLNSGTDSISCTVGSLGRTWTLSSGTDSVSSVQSGSWNITNITGTVSLPTGASTSANQTTANTSLSSIDTKTPALGQALAAASVPVVLTAAQLSTLTPLSTVAATQSGAWSTGRTWTLSSGTDSCSAVQSGTWNINNISGTISLPTGAATASNQTGGSQKTQVVDGSGTVIGPATTISAVNYSPVIQPSNATPGSAVPSRATLVAGTDGTNARTLLTDNLGQLKVSQGVVSLSNFFYDDLNVANGGIARTTHFVVGTLTQLYSHSGAGSLYGFTLNLQGLGGGQTYAIDLVIDGNHLFGASGILTSDLLNSALYDISQVATDNLGFAGFAFPNKSLRWSVPGGGQVSYSTSVVINVKQTAGGAGTFNAGFIALSR